MSLPSALRHSDDTAPSEPTTMVCPHCRGSWPENEAPGLCPTDGLALVRPRDLVDPGDDPMVGRTLEGRYTILAKLGAGSMGTVYRAKQHAMGREVAIKILRGDRAVDESAKARFMREARANSVLASPNTVTVFDFGQSESGEFYLAMELLEGESLGQRLSRIGRLPVPVAVDACRQALRSLGEAHAKGIVHRDLKPDNLFFARVLTSTSRVPTSGGAAPAHDEIVKVLDFGIAKMINADDPNPMSVVETQAGTVFGTPRYMSPEQAQGKPLDARSDLYSLAVILYQMLTGRPPFTDNDAVVVMARHIKSTPKRPSEACPEAQIPVDVENVLMRTLAKEPKDRPASAEIFAGELLAALEADGAMTSGVRSALTNAAGIKIPESLRPPPFALPKFRQNSRALLAAVPLALVAAAAVVYFALARRSEPTSTTAAVMAAPERAIQANVAPIRAAGEPGGGPTAPQATANGVVELDPPTITPDALPTAAPPASIGSSAKATKAAASAAPPRKGARAPAPSARPSHQPLAATSAATPATTPASTTPYGIFE